MAKKRLVFINGGKHFWNREKEFFRKFTDLFDILLVINHRNNENGNYNIEGIVSYCKDNKINLRIIDYSYIRSRNPLLFFKNLKDIIAIKRFKADVFYIESFGSPYFAILSALLLNTKKIIFAILDYKLHPYNEKASSKLSERFYKKIYTNFFKTFQLFSSTQAKMMKKDYPNKNIYFIKLFLIQNDFKKFEKSIIKKDKKKMNFLFFGKIYYYKGVDILIKAGNILSKQNKNFKITIVGDTSEPKKIKQLIENSSVFDLVLRYIDRTEIPTFFNHADYLVLPYREVTQSGPLSISFHFGVTPIVSNLDGFRELIKDNENGYIFQKESPENLATKIQMLLNIDFDKRQRVNNNLKKFVEKEYSIDTFIHNYTKMFKEVINQ